MTSAQHNWHVCIQRCPDIHQRTYMNANISLSFLCVRGYMYMCWHVRLYMYMCSHISTHISFHENWSRNKATTYINVFGFFFELYIIPGEAKIEAKKEPLEKRLAPLQRPDDNFHKSDLSLFYIVNWVESGLFRYFTSGESEKVFGETEYRYIHIYMYIHI